MIRTWATALGVVVWLALLGCGFAVLLEEQSLAGAPAHAPATWPGSTRVPTVAERPTLVVFAHPRCACTRATLRELERVVARSAGRATTSVILVLPRTASGDWSRSPLVQAAREIPGATVLLDRNGVEARRFGTHTSGQALLYDTHGRLRFAGGLTSARGHEGDNAGSDALVARIAGDTPSSARSAVFGCAFSGAASPSLQRKGNP
jgi:hypothetical protein